MTKLFYVINMNDEEETKTSDLRSISIFSWLHLINIINIIILLFVLVKIYNIILLFYEWICNCGKKKLSQHRNILVIGTKTQVNEEIVSQLSRIYRTPIIYLDNRSEVMERDRLISPSLLYSNINLSSQQDIYKLSKYIKIEYGHIDLLIISYVQQADDNKDTTHNFLNKLNTQLLAQFWTVMAFLPGMLERNKGQIVSVALDVSSDLGNQGIMRTIHEDVLQSDTKVRLTLVERNKLLDRFMPKLSSKRTARLIIDAFSTNDANVVIPSFVYYFAVLPMTIIQETAKKLQKVFQFRHHED